MSQTAKLKRFYQTVTADPTDGGFEIHLDGKPVRSPLRALLVLPNKALADAVAAEWAAQKENIIPEAMPHTRLAFTAIDRVIGHRKTVIDQITAFANSDVVCYRATSPEELVARQNEEWNPVLAWAKRSLGARLTTGEGIEYIAQDLETLEALTAAFADKSAFYLAALYTLASNASSLVLALSVANGALDAETAFQSANCDELYQAEKWGTDVSAQTRREARAEEFRSAAEFLRLVQG
jgi:chaperone required for assembly of F1-ATPase